MLFPSKKLLALEIRISTSHGSLLIHHLKLAKSPLDMYMKARFAARFHFNLINSILD